MAKVDLVMPKMGESIMEATILKWLKQPGDTVEVDEPILEIATDKVDSEVPSPVDGVIDEILFNEDDVVEVGKIIATIKAEGETTEDTVSPSEATNTVEPTKSPEGTKAKTTKEPIVQPVLENVSNDDRFYSPLVKSIASKENIGAEELSTIEGSGRNGRVTKADILAYVKTRTEEKPQLKPTPKTTVHTQHTPTPQPKIMATDGEVEIIEMDRMRRLIADHMLASKRTSPHVTSFVEADVTNIVNWRKKMKNVFAEQYGEKLTYTPIFIEAVTRAIQDFPMINISVDGTNIIRKKFINIGMAAALPSGNLIVPVIKNADHLNLLGLTKKVNDLAERARTNKLKPEEIQEGTFTLTNVGTFGNLSGVPIINQPQVAIMSVGAIKKKPAVVETEYGDVIAIRQLMMLSLSYDHRVVDGYLGGSFLRRVADYLEGFDVDRQL